jgi:predicted site-specific integrase-resolvase
MSKYVTPEKARRHFNVSDNTLRKWDSEGKIETIRVGTHRRYKINIGTGTGKQRICYCRVSTSSQKDDLKRQIQFFKTNYPEHTIISDIGSGINFKRKGLKTILDNAIKGNIEQVVVTHKDRLCRFGFELYEGIIREYSNGEILVLNQKQTSPEKELVDDLISIITVFSSRLYGLRSNKIKNKI